MKYVVLILAVLVISASAAVAHDVASTIGTQGMSAQATLSAACETAKTKAGQNLVAMLEGAELVSVSTGLCICSDGPPYNCISEAVGYMAHEHPEEMEDMEEQSMGEDEGQS